MRTVTLVCIIVLLFTSCEYNPLTQRAVRVVIAEEHPWEEASHLPLWYTLAYTTMNGVEKIHLSRGVREITIVIDRLSSVALCAFALGTYAPLGGFIQCGSPDRVELTQHDGPLANLLLEGNNLNPEAVATLDMKQLVTRVGDEANLNASALLIDLLSGVTPKASLQRLTPVAYTLSGIPDGYWVCENPRQESFWMLWGGEVHLLLDHGVTRWYNKERSLIVTLVADSETKLVFISLSDAPLW